MRKRILCWMLVLVLTWIFCACTGANVENNGAAISTQEAPTTQAPTTEVPTTQAPTTEVPTTQAPTTEAPTTEPPTTEAPTTEPAHSQLYLPGYEPQEVFEYFEEVVLHAEYSEGEGNTALVQKWDAPIWFRVCGDPTEEDLTVLDDLFAQLNEIEGFPGIYPAPDEEPENLTISFLGPEDFHASFSEFLNGEDAYGAAQFWYYTATNEIHTAHIGYRTDIDQETRTSVLLEEIVNTLGTSDTVLREDSIVYQYSNDNTALSDMDWVILKLLYDPAIPCGSDYDHCSDWVGKLYY